MKVAKTILILTPFFSPNLGGVETHLDNLCEVLTDQNFKVVVITYQPLTIHAKGKPYEKRKNLEIHRISWFSGNMFHNFSNFFNFLYITPRLLIQVFFYLLFHRERIDVIHAYGLNAAFISRLMKIIFRKRIIMSTEAVYNYQKKSIFSQIVKWSLGGFDKILAQSEVSKEEMVRIGINPDKIEIFHHWINQKKFKPSNKKQEKKALGWEDKFTAIFIGRLIPLKGINVFLEVAKKINKNIAFKVIGDNGPELNKVKTAEKALKNLEYLGPIPHEKLPQYYAASDVLIYPALYKEDMSIAILESLSCGTPVINTNKGSDLYELNNKIAVIVKPVVKEITTKLTYLYDHRDQLSKMVKQAPIFAKKFGPTTAKIIIDSYQQ